MTVEVCVLASGSSGNCTLVRSGDDALLVDAGLSAKEIVRRLAEAGTEIGSVRGICVSHEHSDHTTGLVQMARGYEIPVYANRGTIEALSRQPGMPDVPWRIFSTGHTFAVGGFSVDPFSVPHDAYEPVGFVIACAGARVGVATDMGVVTSVIRARLKDCRAVVIESNHDEKLLRDAKRPEFLKQRIMGRQGHLSNRAAADLLADIAGPHLHAAFLAHLSEDCNRIELALRAARQGLERAGMTHVALEMTYADRISAVWKLPVA